ncbi:pyridoxamine 5'-phosphate oxidase family protein [Spirilliplanes yamanashiensis]|uniref:Pyridoxamine 5'-phosphate oxidase n=1 Tax=Spirilliplanes yamanashiensis TaxID=42233 RepID=A0A8J3Y5N6_9ACTN|nr:pyridoxamine 5'-phosphate oxidase family protein [Spirilliplanes yamanashiensis]GIJ01927.1 hypothetical protein Sya03_12790 [Spirilliplanes yamanashiensis]
MTLTGDVASVLDAYRTCELLTVGRDGTPIAWPVVPVRRADGTLLVTTSIGLPQKALNVRRDPRVALLFSDPTGSGLTAPPQILVHAHATCPDEIVTAAGPAADQWRLLAERQPSSSAYPRFALTRRLMDWYYMRLLITVTPVAVTTRPPAPAGGPMAAAAVPGGGPPAEAARRLPRFTSGVVAAFDESGAPTLARVRPAVAGGALRFTGPALRPGRASLLCHSHDAKLSGLRAFVVTGELTRDGDGWLLTPDRFVPGADGLNPLDMVRAIRRMRATAARYLQRRGLARPQIPWEQYRF